MWDVDLVHFSSWPKKTFFLVPGERKDGEARLAPKKDVLENAIERGRPRSKVVRGGEKRGTRITATKAPVREGRKNLMGGSSALGGESQYNECLRMGGPPKKKKEKGKDGSPS